METGNAPNEVPAWLAGVIAVLTVALTFGYVFVFGGHLAAPAALVLAAGQVGLVLFVVYLLYRFVLAVEKIADKM